MFPKLLCHLCLNKLLDYGDFRKLTLENTEILYGMLRDTGGGDQEDKIVDISIVDTRNSEDGNKEGVDDRELMEVHETADEELIIKSEPCLDFEATETELIEQSINYEDISQENQSFEIDDGGENLSNVEVRENKINRENNIYDERLETVLDIYGDNKYECKVCERSFYSLKFAIRHTKVHNETKKYICDICNKAYSTERNLQKHANSAHKPSTTDGQQMDFAPLSAESSLNSGTSSHPDAMEDLTIEPKKRKKITLEQKLSIIKRFKSGEKPVEIARSMKISQSSVSTICNRDVLKIEGYVKTVSPKQSTTQVTKIRNSILLKMESLLCEWIEKQQRMRRRLRTQHIQKKAVEIFNKLRKNYPTSKCGADASFESFEASRGWYDKFKARTNLNLTSLH
ncbi:uncharacterized protein [Musca autumnalis]|uniref:uncharacterized protein n=1 Tax=Musca autumnalis TaxID=221902 RepID=UPI003CEC8754